MSNDKRQAQCQGNLKLNLGKENLCSTNTNNITINNYTEHDYLLSDGKNIFEIFLNKTNSKQESSSVNKRAFGIQLYCA